LKINKLVTGTLCLLILICIGFIPVEQQFVIKVNASYYNCYQQLFNPAKWKYWNNDLNNVYKQDSSLCNTKETSKGFIIKTPQSIYTVQAINSNMLDVIKIKNGNESKFKITLIPNTAGVTATILIDSKVRIFKRLLHGIFVTDNDKMDLLNLKQFMEDTERYYGFKIRTGYINEKEIIVKSDLISKKEIAKKGLQMLDQIDQLINKRPNRTKANPMAQYIVRRGDSLQMLIGKEVDNYKTAPKGFKMMTLPATKVLIAKYVGIYKDKQTVYNALDRYIKDKYMHPKVAPIERFESRFPANENDTVKFDLIYPIF
jgi:predicted transcriptional regulator YdeE